MTWQVDAFLGHLRRLAPRAVIETAGWRTRHNRTAWAAQAPIGIMAHHSASNPADPPGVAVGRIINGWSGLPGPVYSSFVVPTGDIHLVAAGPANHAGQGISAVRDRTRNRLPPLGNANGTDNMNGNAWYWSVGGQHRGTHPEWPAVQVDGMVAVCAAFCLARGLPAAVAIHHREWTRRRIDMSWRGDLRARVAQLMTGQPTRPEPPTEDEEDREMSLYKVVRNRGIDYAFNAATGTFILVRDPDHYHFLTAAGLIDVPHGQGEPVDDALLGFIRAECARGAGQPGDLARIDR